MLANATEYTWLALGLRLGLYGMSTLIIMSVHSWFPRMRFVFLRKNACKCYRVYIVGSGPAFRAAWNATR
jgi:hypothetical protein